MDREPNKPIYKAGVQSEDNPFEFVLSDESVDRQGDIVRAKGWDLSSFRTNPIALFAHSHEKIIGVWKNVRVQGKQLLGDLKLAEPGTSPLVDETRRLIEQRILKAVSVGFQPMELEPRDKDRPWIGKDIMKASLMEVSVVAVPANPNAITLAKACSSNPEALEQLLVRPDAADPVFLDKSSRPAEIETPNLDRARATALKLGIE